MKSQTIDLSQFLDKKVTVTLRDGKIITAYINKNYNSIYPYYFQGITYTNKGRKWSDVPDFDDIVHITLAEEPKMKKYEQLEQHIAQLQKEVQRLKEEEKKEKDKLPLNFSRGSCLSFLENTKKIGLLPSAFNWSSTPQGEGYWRDIYNDIKPLTDADIIQIQEWVILSYQQEQDK